PNHRKECSTGCTAPMEMAPLRTRIAARIPITMCRSSNGPLRPYLATGVPERDSVVESAYCGGRAPWRLFGYPCFMCQGLTPKRDLKGKGDQRSTSARFVSLTETS